MSKYTRENPFEFEGVPCYLSGGEAWVMTLKEHPREDFKAYSAVLIHALVEAESNEWREDGDGFRRGRFTVGRTDRGGVWDLRHDDFGTFSLFGSLSGNIHLIDDPTTKWTALAVLRDTLDDFLTWHAATYPTAPVEPTGLGAVVEVAGKRYVFAPWHLGDSRPWACCGDDGTFSWAHVTEQGPVTVLSEGVTS